MSRADWALIAQTVASIAAAVAAVFAWLTARRLKQQHEAEERFRWTRGLKRTTG